MLNPAKEAARKAMDSSHKKSPDAQTDMNNSESYSEKKMSDEEDDQKTSIPFFPKANDTTEDDNSFGTLLTNLDGERNDGSAYKFQNWDTDDEYGDDNGDDSRMEADYSQATDAGKYFPPTYTLKPPSACHGAVPEQQYPAADMVFRPPSTSTLHYNYNYPHSKAQSHRQMHGTNSQTHAPASHPTHGYSAQHGFHPNMWYPNAPYNNGGFYPPPYGQHRYPHYNSGYPHDQMVDMLQLSNSGREARNRAEKNRRDKLNGSIQELSTMVPHVAESPRRVDKTAVLRYAAHGLRLQYVFGNTLNHERPLITDSLMKLLDSFFITLTCHGQIILISSSIEQHLGHCQADLYGQNILHIAHPEDHAMLKRQLIPTDLETLFDIQPDDGSDEPRHRTKAEEEYIDKKLFEDRRSFTVRLARAGPRSEPTSYEVVKLDGCFRRSDSAPRGLKTSSFPSGLQLIRRTRGRDDALPLHTISGNDIILIAIARIVRPPKVLNNIVEANSLEYKTRHLIDGRIIDCDQRIGLVAGYMTDEVRNLSPFTFMHQDDVRWVIVALRQMYDCNSSYGESTYRLLTRNGHFIYLQSKGYLEIDKDTNKVHSFVCVNTLLDEEEGKRRVQEMKNKFSIIINTKIPSSSMDMPASENPQQLEKAVLCLIQNLQKTSTDEDEDDASASQFNSSMPYPNESNAHAPLPSRSMSSCSMRSSKTPPLALVPPEASSVKTSISKSVSVVNVTAAKHLRGHILQNPQTPKSPLAADVNEVLSDVDLQKSQCDFNCNCQYEESGTECGQCQESKYRISKLKRSISCSESDDLKLPKRRLKSTEIQHVLSSSLDQIEFNLNKQLSAAIELRDQSHKFEVPNSNQRIVEIMEEHQKQKEIYVNIKSEYEVEIQNQGIDTNTTKTTELQIADDLKPR